MSGFCHFIKTLCVLELIMCLLKNTKNSLLQDNSNLMENSNNVVCIISLFFYTAAELQFAVPVLFFHAARPKAALIHGYLLALQV